MGLFRDEMRPSMVKLNHNKARDFVESPWIPWYLLAAFRLIVAAYCTGWIVFSGFHYSNGGVKWFIWLTNWGFFFVTVSFILSSMVTLWHHCKEKNEIHIGMEMTSPSGPDEKTEEIVYCFPPRWYHKALWVIYTIASNVAILITILYWGVVYNGSKINDAETMGLDISTHLLNSIFLLLELLLSSMPLRLLHVVYPMLFIVVYFLFTVIYWAAGGTNPVNNERYIYTVVDYSKTPGLSVGLFAGCLLVGAPLVQLVLYGLYRFRRFIAGKIGREN